MELLLFFLSFTFHFNCKAQIEKYIPPRPAFARLFNDENAYAYYHRSWRKIEDKLINHHKKTGNLVVIAVIPTTGGYPIEELATATFRQWGIGDKQTNTGLLVLIARKEKQIKIETGYHLEGQVTDLASARIIGSILNPGLDSFNFLMIPRHPTQGYLPTINKAVDTLISLTAKISDTSVSNAARQRTNKSLNRRLLIIACIALILLLYIINKKYRHEKA